MKVSVREERCLYTRTCRIFVCEINIEFMDELVKRLTILKNRCQFFARAISVHPLAPFPVSPPPSLPLSPTRSLPTSFALLLRIEQSASGTRIW